MILLVKKLVEAYYWALKQPQSPRPSMNCEKTVPSSSQFWTVPKVSIKSCKILTVGIKQPSSRPKANILTRPCPNVSVTTQWYFSLLSNTSIWWLISITFGVSHQPSKTISNILWHLVPHMRSRTKLPLLFCSQKGDISWQVHAFLGLMCFCIKIIKSYALMTKSIHDVTLKDIKSQWKAFQDVKEAL